MSEIAIDMFKLPGFEDLFDAQCRMFDRNPDGSFVLSAGEMMDDLQTTRERVRTQYGLNETMLEIFEDQAAAYADEICSVIEEGGPYV